MDDSLSVSYRSHTAYASAEQQESRFTASLQHMRRDIDVSFFSTLAMLRYGVTAGFPLSAGRFAPHYGLELSTSLFQSFLNASLSLHRSPSNYSSGITFQDFIVPVRDDVQTIRTAYTISVSPDESFGASIRYHEESGDRPAATEGYGVWTQFRSINKAFSATYRLPQEMAVCITAATGEHRMNLTLKEHDLTFGDLSNGSLKRTVYSAMLSGLPLDLSAEYVFEQLSMSGVGEIESWPFTSLASSIIANRLSYILTGTFKHHAVELTSHVRSGTVPFTATLSYHRVLADAALEHWEPEFLVFGRKNYVADPFTINDLHLLGFGITAVIPFGGADVTLFADQYLPVAVRYRSVASGTGPAPPPTATAPSRSVTDGGRRGGISLSIHL